jgi:hypothetical protein
MATARYMPLPVYCVYVDAAGWAVKNRASSTNNFLVLFASIVGFEGVITDEYSLALFASRDVVVERARLVVARPVCKRSGTEGGHAGMKLWEDERRWILY